MKKYLITLVSISIYIYFNCTQSLGSFINCGGVSVPTEMASVTRIVIILLKVVAPIVLIIIGSTDFVKAVTGSNDKDIKEKQKMFFKRLIYAGLLFFVITFVQLVLNIASSKADEKNFVKCLKCMTTSDSECSGEAKIPYDASYPTGGELYTPDGEFETPERAEYDDKGNKKKSNKEESND